MLKHFSKNAHGNVLIITGLMILVLVAVAGSSVDFGREQIVKLKLQQSADAAALAAALLPTGVTNAERQRVAERYFALNYPDNYLDLPRPTPVINIGNSIEVNATLVVPMKFISNVGINNLTATARSVVALGNSTLTTTSYDVLLVLDNSNSMADADIGVNGNVREVPPSLIATVHTNARLACQGYYSPLNGIFFNNPLPQYAAYAPYGNYINYCNQAVDGPNLYVANDTKRYFGLTGRTRLNALRAAATGMATQLLSNNAASRVGIITWSSALIDTLPLTSNTNTVTSFLDRMYAVGGTNSTEGLSPAENLLGSFGTGKVPVVVLMTDGFNTQSATVGCYGSPNCANPNDNRPPPCNGYNYCPRATSDSLPICTRLKRQGVILYTIAFGKDVTTGSQAAEASAFLRSCASLDSNGNPRYFEAPDAATLSTTFSTILTTISKVRITE